ncbi:MAG: hypothetical protein ABI723_22995 [Bacteroidia bacterium]
MIQFPYSQESKEYSCNLCCIANLLYLTEEEYSYELSEIEKKEELQERLLNEYTENLILKRYRPNWYFNTIYRIPPCRGEIINCSECFTENNIENRGKGFYKIFLLSVQLHSLHRILAIKEIDSDKLFIIDSIKEYTWLLDIRVVFDRYQVKGISVLRDLSSNIKEVALPYEALKHLIPAI